MGTKTVNGIAYDYVGIEVSVNDETFIDVLSIAYDDPLKPGKQFGTHPQATGRTTGKLEPTASIKLSKQAAEAIRQKLGQGYKQKEFSIVVNYANDGLPMITDELIRVRIVNDKNSHSEGTDGLTEDWELDPLAVKHNGLYSISNPLY